MRKWEGQLLRIVATLLAVILLELAAVRGAAGASLWQKAESQGKDVGWYADLRPKQPGDLLTLVIVEETSATQRAESSNSQDGGAQVGGLGLLLRYIPLFGLSGKDYNEGEGETARSGSLSARLTVQVVEVLPGGILRIEGRQTIVVNGEKQELKVSGLVRSRDVRPDNTVLSTYVANAEIVLAGEGMLNEKQEPGLLTKALNWLF
ncbi:MAG: flagellar basal body L-ring protein FlgH [Limnochordales bacterium]|nr:flagellar basal body L-ring protein FlgH [Limnochordales bacterium]